MGTAIGVNVHATGQPDTPVEVLTALLGEAQREEDVGRLRELVDQAYRLVSGLDGYLDSISTPPSQVRRVP